MQTTTHIATRLAGALMAGLLITASPAAAGEPKARSVVAAPLAKGAGYDLPRGSARVRALQSRLLHAGESPGPIDGRFGPLTEAAVVTFQRRQGLTVDGIVGRDTQAAVRRAVKLLAPGAGYGAPNGSRRVRVLQRRLRLAGEHAGPVDGRFGPLTEAAVIRFQRREGLTVDGTVGDVTMGALKRQLARARRVPPSRSSTPTSAPRRTEPRSQPATDRHESTFPNEGMLALVAGLALGIGAALALVRVWHTSWIHGSVRSPGPTGGPRAALGLLAAHPRPFRRQGAAQGQSVLGYASVSAAARSRCKEELESQLQAIRSECERRELKLIDVVHEREPKDGKALGRPGLGYALRRIVKGEAKGLVVAELSRLSRSVADLGQVLEWFSHTKARLVAAAPGLDTGEQSGRLVAAALIDVSRWERERLSERTRKGLEAARREGRQAGRSGVADNPELRDRIARMRAEGMTLQGIADRLNEEDVPTIRGGAKWRPSSVQAAAGYRRPRQGGRGSPSSWPGESRNGKG
jgi:peptidoglycan hydrolase-like protein with peptidoglycan-binding domain/DNA invertase Pin-like site-specific DNA recombinase